MEARREETRIADWLQFNCNPVNGSITFKTGASDAHRKVGDLLKILRAHRKLRLFDSNPFQYENEDFKLIIGKSEFIGGWLGVSGLEPTLDELEKKWIGQLFRKAKQLPPHKSAVIIGSPLFLWGPEQYKRVLSEMQKELAGGRHRRISGIILCAKHVENSGLMKHLPTVFTNPNAENENSERVAKMGNALFRFPEWLNYPIAAAGNTSDNGEAQTSA